MTLEKISQEEMLAQFKTRYANFIEENKQLATKIKENEIQALKLQGAIETLQYYGAEPEEGGEEVDNVDIPGDDVTDGSPELTT
tara:strand:- start:812 stop:1063 length:252 start_codon:yes stop_codon:yes gene_type:complete